MNQIEEIKNILINIYEDECGYNEGSFTNENFIETIVDSFNELLDYESYIKFKKENGIPLTLKENFFDDFIVSPSLLIKFLSNEYKGGTFL